MPIGHVPHEVKIRHHCIQDWDHRAQEAEVTEVKVEGSIRKKSDDKPQMASEQTSDTLKDLIKHANQPHKKKFGKPVAKKSVGHPGMKPEGSLN